MKKLSLIIAALAMLFAAACTSGEQFRVNGTVEGNPTMNMRAGYYADGVYRTVITAVREGKFEFTGIAGQPSLLEIMDYDYRPLARLYVKNGENYDVHIDPSDYFAVEISGNDISRRWADFLRENKDKMRTDPNAAVAAYVGAHPDDIVSTLLLLTSFDATDAAAQADSLMALITPEARPSSLTEGYMYVLDRLVNEVATGPVLPMKYLDARDSLQNFNPSRQPLSLICVSRKSDVRRDSIVPALRRLSHKYKSERLAIFDFSLDADTVAWKQASRADSASWKQAWAAGGLAAMGVRSLGLPSVPYFVVCDSTGTQLLRTRSAARAEDFVDSRLKNK